MGVIEIGTCNVDDNPSHGNEVGLPFYAKREKYKSGVLSEHGQLFIKE